jgi:hypothetical protein
MPSLFHYITDSLDFLGHSHQLEMIVIAGNEDEPKQEVAAYYHLHDEVDKWNIARILEIRELKPGDPYAQDYSSKGAHSYISPQMSGEAGDIRDDS